MENDNEDDDDNEDETMTMTQPDLVSKLREVIARWRELADSGQFYTGEATKANYPTETIEKHRQTAHDLQKCADELESFLPGREGQAAINFDNTICFTCEGEQGLPAIHTVNICSACFGAEVDPDLHSPCGPSQPETEGEIGRQPAANASPSVQAAIRIGRHAAGEMHLSAIVFCAECRMYVEIGTDDCPHAIALAAPSTPIVPSTAGLSAHDLAREFCNRRGPETLAEQVQRVADRLREILPQGARGGALDAVVVEVAEEFAILDEDIPRLRGILARMQPAMGLSAEQVREALERIVRKAIARGWKIAADVECKEIIKHCESALAERPAPAGEVKGKKS